MTTLVYSYPAFIKKLTDNFGMPFDAVIEHGGLMWLLTSMDYNMYLMPEQNENTGYIAMNGVYYECDKGKPVKTNMTLIEFITGKTEVKIIET